MGYGIDETSCTLVEMVLRRAASAGNAIAFTFLRDGERDVVHLTYEGLAARAAGIGARLREAHEPGSRALLMHPDGRQFIEAFFGCLYAGLIAVPVLPPDPFNAEASARRLARVAEDAGASCVLSSRALVTTAGAFAIHAPPLRQRPWIATDDLPADGRSVSSPVARASDDLALLQYTSGSTGAPKGVMLSHANLLAHGRGCSRMLELPEEAVVLSWLPLYHDMGLIGTVLFALQAGYRSIQMPPAAFLQRPYRWLKAMSDHQATLSVAPNFGYELCCRKIHPDEIATLDLGGWTAALNGSERVQPATLERFARMFAPAGFRREALLPCYGLAEASLMVSTASPGDPPAMRHLSPSTTVVACGAVTHGQHVLIVDPVTAVPLGEGAAGEIWVSGPCVGRGYWQKPEATQRTFEARPAGEGGASYLRTGDLGFLQEGRLVVVGRLKDLIVIRGVNHVPEDIEQTVSEKHESLRPGGAAAFAVDGDDGERLVLVHELRPEASDAPAIVASIRTAIAATHGLHVAAIVLVAPRTLPKTSSGKVRRRECRERFLRGTLDVVAEWRESGWSDAGDHREAGDAGDTARRIRDWLVVQVAALRDLPTAQIDVGAPFSAYGMDSAEAAILTVDLEDWLRIPLPSELVWNRPTIASLADALAEMLATSDVTASPLS